jgi:hypothetical protein
MANPKSRYTYKYPRTTWSQVKEGLRTRKRLYWYSLEKAVSFIVDSMKPGYTSEPFMQLIEVSHDGSMHVVAERTPSEWLGSLEAAGFVSRRVA